MAVHKGLAHQGKAIHKSKPTSKLSKHQFITKPESRETGAKKSVAGAEAFIKRLHG